MQAELVRSSVRGQEQQQPEVFPSISAKLLRTSLNKALKSYLPRFSYLTTKSVLLKLLMY
jgi:hypothetical protein